MFDEFMLLFLIDWVVFRVLKFNMLLWVFRFLSIFLWILEGEFLWNFLIVLILKEFGVVNRFVEYEGMFWCVMFLLNSLENLFNVLRLFGIFVSLFVCYCRLFNWLSFCSCLMLMINIVLDFCRFENVMFVCWVS